MKWIKRVWDRLRGTKKARRNEDYLISCLDSLCIILAHGDRFERTWATMQYNNLAKDAKNGLLPRMEMRLKLMQQQLINRKEHELNGGPA